MIFKCGRGNASFRGGTPPPPLKAPKQHFSVLGVARCSCRRFSSGGRPCNTAYLNKSQDTVDIIYVRLSTSDVIPSSVFCTSRNSVTRDIPWDPRTHAPYNLNQKSSEAGSCTSREARKVMSDSYNTHIKQIPLARLYKDLPLGFR
jgi:hypothetical protein